MVAALPNQKSVRALVSERYSVRKYLEKPVPRDVIRGIIDTARLAPSNGNSQPWHIAVVSGKARVRVEAEIFKMIEAGVEPHPVYPPGGMGLKGVHKDRQRDCGFRYYGHMNVAREDMDARLNLARENWKFYGAPHAAFISMPKTMHRANAIDLGIFLQTIMLLFAERGIACIPQGALASYPEPVRKEVFIPEENAIMCGLSFGYEDRSAKVNELRMPRASLEEVASFAE